MISSSAKYAGLAPLRRFVTRTVEERCELCASALASEHLHLFDLDGTRLVCTCRPCSLLFENSQRYRVVPRDVWALSDLNIDDALWQSLGVPIDLVFIFRGSRSATVSAIYPSPAGPTESPLDTEVWEEFAALDARLRSLSPDVEAFLANRVGNSRRYYVVPIDECYRLTGLVRRTWRGFSGGDEAWRTIETFFEGLDRRARLKGGVRA